MELNTNAKGRTCHLDEPMTSNKGSKKPAPKAAEPGWANGLRKLYDSVVDEPLPDSFKDLLDKLDTPDADGPE